MDAIEKRARELLAAEYKDRGSLVNAMNIEMGGQTYAAELAAIIAALTPPEGYVLVPERPSARMCATLRAAGIHDLALWNALLAARPEVP